MEKIKYVKILIGKNLCVEDYLESVTEEYVFMGSYFDSCNTMKEIYNYFLENLNPDEIVEWVEIRTYTNKTNLIKNKYGDLFKGSGEELD